MEQGRKSITVPLTPEAGGQLVGRVPLTASGTYRVHLVGAETGFENKFSPEYEIRAEPDLGAAGGARARRSRTSFFPRNEIVDVRGTASDDQGLAKVAQLVRINEGAWNETFWPRAQANRPASSGAGICSSRA